MASLRLEPRPWEENKITDGGTGAPRLKFRVLLSKSCPDDGLDVSWKWREIEIEPMETSEGTIAKSKNDSQKLNIATLSLVSSYV